MQIALLHTADVHVATFDALLRDAGFEGSIVHQVRADFLERARDAGLDSVRGDTLAAIDTLLDADAVVCTCSTLGPLADEIARTRDHVFRIDRPVMERACAAGADILVAICLQSTQGPTLELLESCAIELGQIVRPRLVVCTEAWPLFEAGDMVGYASRIAATVRDDIAANGRVDCVVLGQASMRVAQESMGDLGVPVMSSPEPAALRAIEVALRGSP